MFCGEFAVLLEDQPYPVGMDKAKILFLAQRRALKEGSGKEESGDVGSGEKGTMFEGATSSVIAAEVGGSRTPLKRTRTEISEGSVKKSQQSDPPVQIEKQKEVEGTFPGRETSLVQRSTLFPLAEQGTEKCTLLRFQTGSGWLGKGSGATAPVAALGAFELGPDQEKLDTMKDEEIFSGVKDTLGAV